MSVKTYRYNRVDAKTHAFLWYSGALEVSSFCLRVDTIISVSITPNSLFKKTLLKKVCPLPAEQISIHIDENVGKYLLQLSLDEENKHMHAENLRFLETMKSV